MKNLKKMVALLFATTVFASIGSTYAFADTVDHSMNPEIESAISELLDDGMSQKDAEYYAALDAMFREMEKNGEVIQLDDSVEPLDINVALENQEVFREQVLEKDPAAIKCALSMNSSTFGQEDLQNLISTYQGQNEYTIVYSDGSKISYSSGADEAINPDTLYANGTTSETFGSGSITRYTNYTGYGEYKMTSAANYSKNRIDVEYKYASTGATMTYAQGNQSSYGVILISNSNGGEISRAKSTATKAAEANNQVIYQISGSVGGSLELAGPSVSVSISGGANWTQTVYYRVTSNGKWSAVASTYV